MTASTLVVGGSSPLGAAVASELTGRGAEFALASRRGPLQLDVTDATSIDALFATTRYERIVYLANPTDLSSPRTASQHLEGLTRLVSAAARSGTSRVVFASSAAVYGTSRDQPLAEGDALLGDSPYAHLKSASEDALREKAGDGLSVVALRIFNVFGPGFDRSLINRLASPAETPPLQVSPRFVRDYVHCADVARAVSSALAADSSGFAAINIGSGIATSNADLARLAKPGSFIAQPAGDDTFSVADIALATELLDFATTRSVEQTLAMAD